MHFQKRQFYEQTIFSKQINSNPVFKEKNILHCRIYFSSVLISFKQEVSIEELFKKEIWFLKF